ncbi:MAG: phage holin family protein [Bacteroidetes bacterium]|nr:phage holin family protein [Rhodothermia bacterium]MCX7906869.1 phage holin family protein [Bacteroidota bacterium]MDW8285278.1 phage holin family protein [Bacteroidota bacterium]
MMETPVTLLERVLLRLQELVRDLVDLMEARFELFRLDLAEQLAELIGRLLAWLLLLGLLALGLSFGLLALALWLGGLLGHAAWGFALVGAGLLLLGGLGGRLAFSVIGRAVRRGILRALLAETIGEDSRGPHRSAADAAPPGAATRTNARP